jgi:UDP-GlcNAc:undecaprenyl-phosphate GlcNAc-1-phosphate transferase
LTELFVHLAVAALTAGAVTSLAIPLLVRLAAVVWHPGVPMRADLRPAEGRAVPRLGGVALALGVALASALGLALRWTSWSAAVPRAELLALALGAALVFLLGFADDLVGVGPGQKLLVQLLAAWLVVGVGWSFGSLRLPLLGEIELGAWGPLLSLVWIVGVTNAINLLDGLDGLAGGVAAIVAASLLVYALVQGNQGTSILFAAVFGACLGFLWHNWEPARIFLGDSGSLTLGFLFGAMTAHSSQKATAAVAILVPILALGLPVIDTLLVVLLRFVEGRGRPLAARLARVVRADRNHLHHALEHAVRRRGLLVAAIYAVVALFCAAALAVAVSGSERLGLELLLVEIATVAGIRWLGFAARARELALAQRAEARRRMPWTRPGAAGGAPEGERAGELGETI